MIAKFVVAACDKKKGFICSSPFRRLLVQHWPSTSFHKERKFSLLLVVITLNLRSIL